MCFTFTIGTIEALLFTNGIGMTLEIRVIYENLQDWFTFLATMCGLLHDETLFKAELSDVFRVLVQKRDDLHPLSFVVTIQFVTGKVNHGFKLYGQVVQNFDVNLCHIETLGLYLLFRFCYSNKMEKLDFCDNSAWFNIELLLMTFNLQDNMKCMKDKTYVAAVKNICERNNTHPHTVLVGYFKSHASTFLYGCCV